MPRHDPSFDTDSLCAAGDYTVALPAVSYLSQFPQAATLAAGPEAGPFVIEPEPQRLPVAHMFSS